MVGVERFELPTSCSQSRRATRLRYTPLIDTLYVRNFKCQMFYVEGEVGLEPTHYQDQNLVPYQLGYPPLNIKKLLNANFNLLIFNNNQKVKMVGVAGFEPATARSQSECATRLRYTP